MNFLTFLIASFATFRIAKMLSEEAGPANVFGRIRAKFPTKTNPGKGVRCILCLSVWSAALFTGLLWTFGQIETWLTPIYWLGLSGGAITINSSSK